MKQYSQYFETLYDEQVPTYGVGRGCHYSIFQAKDNHTSKEKRVFYFAVVWDEDHDERIFEYIERLYQKECLQNYIIFGERKGIFTAVLPENTSVIALNNLPNGIQLDSGDYWSVSVVPFSQVGDGSLIHDTEEKTKEYVKTILAKLNLLRQSNVFTLTAEIEIPSPEKNILIEEIEKDDDDELKELEEAFQKPIIIDPYREKIIRKVEMSDDKKSKTTMYGFPTEQEAKEKEFLWQQKTIEKFFKINTPLKEGRKSQKIYTDARAQINNPHAKALSINGLCRRSFIIALAKLLSEEGKMPELRFRLGGTENSDLGATVIKFCSSEIASKKRQLGNFKMEIVNEQYPIAYGKGCIT